MSIGTFREWLREAEINEAQMIKNKFKKGQVVQFYDNQGKKNDGVISNFEYDEMVNGNWVYFYNIEGTKKLFKDIPEGNIIKKSRSL